MNQEPTPPQTPIPANVPQQTPAPAAPADSNGAAIASLILGILSLTGFGLITGIPAIITGIMGMKHTVNRNMGVAGLIMGIISTVVSVLVIIFFIVLMIIGASAAASSSSSDTEYDYDSTDSSLFGPSSET